MKQMKWEEAVLTVLREANEALHYKAILCKIENEGIRETKGKTPDHTVARTCKDLVEKGQATRAARGVYQIIQDSAGATQQEKQAASEEADSGAGTPSSTQIPDEKEFYEPFADWLIDEDEVTKAIPLGGKKFGAKWGTPDVIGIRKPMPGDIVPQPVEIVSAEIKTDPQHLITAFGQAVAYCLFSHRSYLVVPKEAPAADRSRLDCLCQAFGLGLVLFDRNPQDPDFEIRTRPRRQEPDYLFMNENMKKILELFA